MQIWLSSTIFRWSHAYDGGQRSDPVRMRRPHEILSHAENVLAKNNSEFSVADAILALKRVVNSRLQHLEELYRFSDLFPKGLGALERLEKVGLARPLVVKQLFDIRNDIEHRDAPPPSPQRAQELVDATWYFLRTTDYACKVVPYSVKLRLGEEGSFPPEQWLLLRFLREKPGRFEIAGWVPVELLSERAEPEFFELDLVKLKSKPTTPPTSNDILLNAGYVNNSARGDDERWIDGEAVLSLDLQREFWRLAIDAL